MCRRPYQWSRIHSLAQRPLLTTSDAIRRPKIRIVLADQIELFDYILGFGPSDSGNTHVAVAVGHALIAVDGLVQKRHLLGAICRDPRSSRLDGFDCLILDQ